MLSRPMHKHHTSGNWQSGNTQPTPSNIYEVMMTRNITQPTYLVDEVGQCHTITPSARTRPAGGAGPGGSITFGARKPKGMLDRSAEGGPAFVHTTPI